MQNTIRSERLNCSADIICTVAAATSHIAINYAGNYKKKIYFQKYSKPITVS
jgi:hypothetical protein